MYEVVITQLPTEHQSHFDCRLWRFLETEEIVSQNIMGRAPENAMLLATFKSADGISTTQNKDYSSTDHDSTSKYEIH